MKLRHSELACHQVGLMEQLREFWTEGHLCDVVLKSIDGIEYSVHRNVLSAASAVLKKLLCAPFLEAEQIRQGKPIEFPASGGVVGAFVDYIYGGEPDVATTDVVELLRLASAYDLPCLAEAVESDLQACLDSQLALRLLQESVIRGQTDLRLACEKRIAQDFQQCMVREEFLKLTGRQLQRIIQREDLNISREEVVVEALLKWQKASTDREKEVSCMLSNIDFPSLSTSNLQVLCDAAQSWGPTGADWECEVKQALTLHRKRPTKVEEEAFTAQKTAFIKGRKRPPISEDSRAHRPKRQCLSNWTAGLGASRSCDHARHLTSAIKNCGSDLVWHQGAFFLSRVDPPQIVSYKHGNTNLRAVAGQGSAINGFNQLQMIRGLAMLPTGEMIVGHGDEDERTQVLSFQNGVGKVLLEVPGLKDVCCSPNGVIYVLTLDTSGTRVQRVEGSRLKPVVNSEDLPEEEAFEASGIFVSKQEVLYISDCRGDSILRFDEANSDLTVVADFDDFGDEDDDISLGAVFVTKDERIFVCDLEQKRILISHAGETSELDVSIFGKPLRLSVEDGQLNVLIRRETGEGWVYQFALPPKLNVWWCFVLAIHSKRLFLRCRALILAGWTSKKMQKRGSDFGFMQKCSFWRSFFCFWWCREQFTLRVICRSTLWFFVLRQVRGPHERERCEFACEQSWMFGSSGRVGGTPVEWILCGFNSFDNAMDWSSQADASDPKGRALKIVHGEDHAQS